MLLASLTVLAIALGTYLHYKAYHISTDDAFIDARTYAISPRPTAPSGTPIPDAPRE